jgi:hypothetical protein
MKADMGKYTPLTEFLSRQVASEVAMTFAQIERVIDAKLPPKAQKHRAWWSNSPSNSVMTKAWLDAGFRSERVDMEGRRLVFRRVKPQQTTVSRIGPSNTAEQGIRKRHPLIGALKGWIRIAPGTDLTEPADPEWGEQTWGKKT